MSKRSVGEPQAKHILPWYSKCFTAVVTHFYLHSKFQSLPLPHITHTHTHGSTTHALQTRQLGALSVLEYSSKQHRLRIKRHTTNTASQKITERKRPRVYHGTHASGVHVSPPALCLSPAPFGSARRQQISVLLVCLSPPRVPTVAYVTQAEVQGTPYR